MKVAVVGAGSWGTALAILLARNGHEVTLAGRESEEMEAMRSCRENMRYMPGFVIPDGVGFSTDLEHLNPTEMTVIAVPSSAVREVVKQIQGEHPLVAIASKGLEPGTASTMSQVVAECLPQATLGVLSGPNLAIEIVRGVPTAAVAACAHAEGAEAIRGAFMCRTFRVYVSTDVLGVELAGALKNVLAIGAGLADGLGFGDNTKAALITRGLNEMSTLGVALGAQLETFMGLAGVGDLFATATSSLSRNYRVGKALGQGLGLAETLEKIDQVAEGVSTSESAMILSRRNGVPMPVFEAIEAVVRGRIHPMKAVSLLMERTPREEGISVREAN